MRHLLVPIGCVLLGACAVRQNEGESRAACPEPVIEGCAVDRSRGDLSCTLEHDGAPRTYRVVVPETGACAPTPLVFDLHGLTSNPVQQAWISGLDERARTAGFVAVHPQGSGEVASWNAGTCCGAAAMNDVDDVGFLDAIRERLGAALAIDPRRVYATGLSNGGYLSHRLACERAEVYAAIAPVAGVLGVPRCDAARPVPVLQFHGTSDQLVPYLGGGLGGGLSAPATMQWWAARNACGATPVVGRQQGDVVCERWEGCAGGADVELCTVTGGGHSWPGGPDLILPALGPTTQDIDASEVIWEFFAAHPLPEALEDWTPAVGPDVPLGAPVDEECAVEPVEASSLEARLVLPEEAQAPAPSGGDPAGAWTITSAELYLPPIATREVVRDESRVLAAGRVALGEDGRFAIALDLQGEIVTSSYGVLHLSRHVRATGTFTAEGGRLAFSADCGGTELPAVAELSRLDETHARVGWLVSSGLIGDVRLVVVLEESPGS